MLYKFFFKYVNLTILFFIIKVGIGNVGTSDKHNHTNPPHKLLQRYKFFVWSPRLFLKIIFYNNYKLNTTLTKYILVQM